MFEQVGFWNGVKSEGAIKPKNDEERSALEKKREKGRVGVGGLSCIKSNEIEDTHIWQSWQLPSFHHYLHWLSNFHTFLTLLSLSLPSLCLCPCPAVPVPVLSILWIRRRYTHLIRFPPSWTIVFRKIYHFCLDAYLNNALLLYLNNAHLLFLCLSMPSDSNNMI